MMGDFGYWLSGLCAGVFLTLLLLDLGSYLRSKR
jgi:hypothetical protein